MHCEAYNEAENESGKCPGCANSGPGMPLTAIALDLKMRVELTGRPLSHRSPEVDECFFKAVYLFSADGARMDVPGDGTRPRPQRPIGNLFGGEM